MRTLEINLAFKINNEMLLKLACQIYGKSEKKKSKPCLFTLLNIYIFCKREKQGREGFCVVQGNPITSSKINCVCE